MQSYSFSLRDAGLVLFSSSAGSVNQLFIFSPQTLHSQSREYRGVSVIENA